MEKSTSVPLRYTFRRIENCNMCGASEDMHKVLGKRLNKSQGRNPKRRTGISTTICKCKNCGLIFSNPQPIPFDIQDHYGVPPDDYWIEEYFQVDEKYFQGEVKIVKGLLDFKQGMKSLDIGAGIGKAMIVLEKAGFDTYGFEASKPFHEKAISQMGIKSDRLKLGMIEEVEYPENYFDFVTFGAVLEHLYDPSDSILRAMNWLKPGGIMHIEVPSSDWLVNRMINFYYRLGRTDYVGNLSPMHSPFHLYEFGFKSFQQHAMSHKYEIALHDYYVCPTHMPKILDNIIKPYMKWTNTGMQLCVWLRKV